MQITQEISEPLEVIGNESNAVIHAFPESGQIKASKKYILFLNVHRIFSFPPRL